MSLVTLQLISITTVTRIEISRQICYGNFNGFLKKKISGYNGNYRWQRWPFRMQTILVNSDDTCNLQDSESLSTIPKC